jgi:hypothetical protein
VKLLAYNASKTPLPFLVFARKERDWSSHLNGYLLIGLSLITLKTS